MNWEEGNQAVLQKALILNEGTKGGQCWGGTASSGVCGACLLPEGDKNVSLIAKRASSPVSQHSSRGGRMAVLLRSNNRGDQGDDQDEQDLEEITQSGLMSWILMCESYV